jgi:hypothetical protein
LSLEWDDGDLQAAPFGVSGQLFLDRIALSKVSIR